MKNSNKFIVFVVIIIAAWFTYDFDKANTKRHGKTETNKEIKIGKASGSDKDYWAVEYDGIYDGDTIYTKVDLPPPLNKTSIRIYGIDTPEKGGRAACDKESKASDLAAKHLIKFIGDSKFIYLRSYEWDKFGGRILADAYVKTKDGFSSIREFMLASGDAIEYYGEKKSHDWCSK